MWPILNLPLRVMTKLMEDGIGQLLMPSRDVQTETVLLARLVVVQPSPKTKKQTPDGVLTCWDSSLLTSSKYSDEVV